MKMTVNLNDCICMLKEQIERLASYDNSPSKQHTVYSNTAMMAILGVNNKLIKKYRDQGLLAYSRVGDKFWYSQTDLENFLASNYYPAFATAS